jgi:putative transposase
MTVGDDYRRGRHAVSALRVHLVFVTKYRRGVLQEAHHAALREVFAAVCEDFGARLVEAGGEDDYAHLEVAYPPAVSVSGLVNSLKGVSSRLLRKRFGRALKTHRNHLWSPSYFAASACEGTEPWAPLARLRTYVEAQRIVATKTG